MSGRKSGVVADILASAERENDFIARAEEAFRELLKKNMARLRGLAILQGNPRIAFDVGLTFDFTPGKEAIETRLSIRACVEERTVHKP